MKTLTWEYLPALLGAFAFGHAAIAADGANKDEAVAMVKKAVATIKADGTTRLTAEDA